MCKGGCILFRIKKETEIYMALVFAWFLEQCQNLARMNDCILVPVGVTLISPWPTDFQTPSIHYTSFSYLCSHAVKFLSHNKI